MSTSRFLAHKKIMVLFLHYHLFFKLFRYSNIFIYAIEEYYQTCPPYRFRMGYFVICMIETMRNL